MTNRHDHFKIGSWFHCYNHSIEGRNAFADERDYSRFLELLYLANDEWPLRRDALGLRALGEILTTPRGNPLVAIGAFCLMSNSFNLAIREVVQGGTTTFMRKLGTGYTLYFNSRHKRVGNLFLKPFRSRQVLADQPLQNLVSYIHSHPAELYEPKWKIGHVVDPQFLEEHLTAYPYSSLGAYAGIHTLYTPILDTAVLPLMRPAPLQKMLKEARQHSADSGVLL